MAIKGPRSASSIGYVSSQFRDMLAIHLANLERQEREAKEKSEAFWTKINVGVGLAKGVKQYRDAYLADKRLDKVHFQHYHKSHFGYLLPILIHLSMFDVLHQFQPTLH